MAEIEAMEKKSGNRLYRGLLKRVARVWNPEQNRETTVLNQVLAQMAVELARSGNISTYCTPTWV